MDRILSKVIIFVLCSGLFALEGSSTQMIIGMLVALTLTTIFELPALPEWARAACPLLYVAMALVIPDFLIYLPLAAGDLFVLRAYALRFAWTVPLITGAIATENFAGELSIFLGVVLLSAASCLLSWRGKRVADWQEAARSERDMLAQSSHVLELRNQNLLEKQDLELRVATLNERSRIAREIHDNVGHLLTRSVLQVKALGVVHAKDKQLAGELEQVSATLDKAFETVRASVHDLHDDSNNLQTQLSALAKEIKGINVQVEYRAGELPARVAYAFLAIAREALSNSGRHSNATSVHVAVVEFPGLYQLIVHDNGSATPSGEKTAGKDGMGLASMEERTRSLGGVFRINSDKGFKVLVTIPKANEE